MKNTIASYIDHTLLKPESTEEEITMLCDEAKEYKFKTVCINPYWVKTARAILEGSDVGITTVIGFPLGASTTKIKVAETKEDRKSTRLNSSHVAISYAVFCLKKKKQTS